MANAVPIGSANPELKPKSQGRSALDGSGEAPVPELTAGILVGQSRLTCPKHMTREGDRMVPQRKSEMLLFDRVGTDAGDAKTTEIPDVPWCPQSQGQRTSSRPHRSSAPCSHSLGHRESARDREWPTVTQSPEPRDPVSQASDFLDPQAMTDAW